MKLLIAYTSLLLFAAGCTKTPALVVAERNHNHWMTPGARLVALDKANTYPDCDSRTADTISSLWWILDSIGDDNTIVIRRDFSHTYDTLDGLDMRLLRKEDPAKYHQMKHHGYYSKFRDGYEHYWVFRRPDSSAFRTVCVDSLAGIVVPCIYTECSTRRERFRTSFRNGSSMDKAFVFRMNVSDIGIHWAY